MDKIFKSQNYDYIHLNKSISLLCKEYPFLTEMSIGKSVLGRNITAIKLGKSEDYALFCAAFHGSEHITTNILMIWFEKVCKAIKNDESFCGIKSRKGLFERGIIIIPRINPDGCEIAINGGAACGERFKEIHKMCKGDFIHYNANIRGVDLNHNFNADWENLKKKEQKAGIHFPAATRFGGYSPESEPETVALTDFCKTVNIRHALALHTQGEVIYWSFGERQPPHSRKMAEILSSSCGYSLDSAVGIADGGGFKDWFITEFNRPAFTVELGKGENPLPISDAEKISAETEKMFTLAGFL